MCVCAIVERVLDGSASAVFESSGASRKRYRATQAFCLSLLRVLVEQPFFFHEVARSLFLSRSSGYSSFPGPWAVLGSFLRRSAEQHSLQGVWCSFASRCPCARAIVIWQQVGPRVLNLAWSALCPPLVSICLPTWFLTCLLGWMLSRDGLARSALCFPTCFLTRLLGWMLSRDGLARAPGGRRCRAAPRQLHSR